ncbi:unnamed protein product [Urochloa humidicola]
MIDKIEFILDFCIFNILDLDLLLGYPLEKLLDASHGSLDGKLREAVFAIATSYPEDPMVKLLAKQNPLEKVMYVSPFISFELVLFEVAEFAALNKHDSEDTLHRCEDERPSSPSIEFDFLPTGSYYVVPDHDESLEMATCSETSPTNQSWDD